MKLLTTQLLTILFALFLCATKLHAQSHHHYFNLLEKEKYSKVDKKMTKGLIKDSTNLIWLDIKAKLYLMPGFKKYDPKISYASTCLIIKHLAQDEFKNSQIKSHEKNHMTNIELVQYLDTIGLKAYDDAKTEDQVVRYNDFLAYYKEVSQYIKDSVVRSRNTAAFRDAKEINTVESYQSYMDVYPESEHFEKAKVLRNIRAFERAKNKNTVVAVQYFIDTYPNAVQIPEAILLRNSLAFSDAKQLNTVEAYQTFIDTYPDAIQVPEAMELRDALAFEQAKKENTSKAYEGFIKKYPNSKLYQEAFGLFEIRQFEENTIEGDYKSYINFIKNYFKNSYRKAAMDSVIKIGCETKDLIALKYGADYFEGEKQNESLRKYYEILTEDGEPETLLSFYKNYTLPARQQIDNQIINLNKKLLLHLPYQKKRAKYYDEFIKLTAPREIAFVALQRMISPYFEKQNWDSALIVINKYQVEFKEDTSKISNLKSLVAKNYDKSVKKRSVGSGINTITGQEYAPILTDKGDVLYFCGKDRRNNVGGEDIFLSKKSYKGYWRKDQLVTGLSSSNTHDAPLSVAENGTKMLLFKDGKIYFSNKTSNSWTAINNISSTINSAEWQADAMICSDGKTLIFSAARKEGLNTNTFKSKNYHGDNLQPTDLYVSKLDENNEWSKPITLGKKINTRYCERTPFLHPDMKTLYFSSDGRGGFGKLDVFKSTRLHDTCWDCWSEPINLGKEFNGPESDKGYKITKDGSRAYFSVENKNTEKSSVLFLLDVSGSMSGDKIYTLKKETKQIVESLINQNAEVAILAFSNGCYNPMVATANFSQDADSLSYFVENLYAGGGTPMYSAYKLASMFLKDSASKSSKKKTVVLMTDGDAGDCITLEQVIRGLKSKRALFKTQTIAYGVSPGSRAYDDLNYISKQSKGKFFYAAQPQDLGKAFDNASQDIIGLNSGGSNKDIVYVNLPKYLKPNPVASVSGKLLNNKGEPVDATIRWEDLSSGEVIGRSKSDPKDGSYFIILPMGKHYGYFVDDSTFFPISNNLDLTSTDRTISVEENIKLVTFKEMLKDGIAVNINNLFFDFGKYDLLPNSKAELIRVAEIINRMGVTVEIRGHTDNVGEDAKNQLLSENRAKSVMDFLVKQGCKAEKLSAVGFGEKKPVATNQTDTGRAKNRRVELLFKY